MLTGFSPPRSRRGETSREVAQDRIVPAPLPLIQAMEGAAAKEGATLRLLHKRQAKKWMGFTAEADKDLAHARPGRRKRVTGTSCTGKNEPA